MRSVGASTAFVSGFAVPKRMARQKGIAMEDSKKSEIATQADMGHFLNEAIERESLKSINDLTSDYLDVADKVSLQTFMLRKQGSARDFITEAQRSLEMAVNDMAEARMAEWLLKKRSTLLTGKRARK